MPLPPPSAKLNLTSTLIRDLPTPAARCLLQAHLATSRTLSAAALKQRLGSVGRASAKPLYSPSVEEVWTSTATCRSGPSGQVRAHKVQVRSEELCTEAQHCIARRNSSRKTWPSWVRKARRACADHGSAVPIREID